MFRNLDDPVAIDYDFFLRAALLYNTSFKLLEESLVKYRIHPKQLSHKNISNTLGYLNKVRCDILACLEPSEKKEYLEKLNEYNKKQPFSKKIKNYSLKTVTNYFPNPISDNLLTFYLNKIRTSR